MTPDPRVQLQLGRRRAVRQQARRVQAGGRPHVDRAHRGRAGLRQQGARVDRVQLAGLHAGRLQTGRVGRVGRAGRLQVGVVELHVGMDELQVVDRLHGRLPLHALLGTPPFRAFGVHFRMGRRDVHGPGPRGRDVGRPQLLRDRSQLVRAELPAVKHLLRLELPQLVPPLSTALITLYNPFRRPYLFRK